MAIEADRPLGTALPEYYVLLCAQRYAAVARELAICTTSDTQREAKTRLSHIFESGMIEFRRKIERREGRFPHDFRKALIEKDGSTISRAISREESEILRYSYAVPAFTSIDNLSADEMLGLADMFEGWAQSDQVDPVKVARLHGWADGFRSLVEVVGVDYVPPETPPGAPVSLMKFLAVQTSQDAPLPSAKA
jgi:hypothetical protein